MPTFPTQTNLLSTDVPGVSTNPEAAGAVQRAIGKVGGQIADSSLQIIHQIKTSEAIDASATAHNDDRLWSEPYLAKLKIANPDGYVKNPDGTNQTNPDGTPVTITQAYKDAANQRFHQNQDAMPSEAAQQLYREKSGAFFTSQTVAAFTDEQNLKLQSQAYNQQNRDQSRANSLTSLATPTKLYDLANESAKDILENTGPGRIYNSTQAKEKILKNEQQFAESAGKFALNQALSTPDPGSPPGLRQKNIDQWITVLNEDPNGGPLTQEAMGRKAAGLKVISEMFNPDKKAEILHSLMAARKQADTYDKTSYDAKWKEFTAQVSNGKGGDPNVAAQLMAEGRSLREANVETPIGLAQKVASLSAAKAITSIPPGLKFLQPNVISSTLDLSAHSAWIDAQKQLATDPESNSSMIGSSSEKSVRDKMRPIENAWAADAKNDWAKFVETGDQTSVTRRAQIDQGTVFSNPNSLAGKGALLQDQIQTTLDMGKLRFPNNPENVRVISKDDSTNLGSYFKGTQASDDQKAQAILTMKKEYGQYFPQVVQQLISDGNMKPTMAFATMLNHSETQTKDLLSGLLSDKSKSKDWEVLAANNPDFSEKNLNTQIGSKFNDFISAKAQQNPGDPLAAMSRSVIVEAAKSKAVDALLTGRASDSSEAVDQAYNALIKNNGDLVEVKSGGLFGSSWFASKQNVWMPKQVGEKTLTDADRQATSQFWQDHLTPDGLKKLGIVPPPLPGGAPPTPEAQDLFYQQMASSGKNAARVVFNEKLGGFQIYYQDRYYNSDMPALTVGPDGRRKALLVPADQVFGHPVAGEPHAQFIPGQGKNSSSLFDIISSAEASQSSPKEVPIDQQVPLNENVSFKESRMKQQLETTDPRVRYIMNHVASELEILGDKAVVTRVTDHVKGETPLHQTGRAIDVSTRQVDASTVKALVDNLNMAYTRSDGRPTAMYHKIKGGALHLHIQVPRR